MHRMLSVKTNACPRWKSIRLAHTADDSEVRQSYSILSYCL